MTHMATGCDVIKRHVTLKDSIGKVCATGSCAISALVVTWRLMTSHPVAMWVMCKAREPVAHAHAITSGRMTDVTFGHVISEWYGKYRRKSSWIVKRFGKYRRKSSWKVNRYRLYGRKVSWVVKWYGKYGKKVGWIVKWYGKYTIQPIFLPHCPYLFTLQLVYLQCLMTSLPMKRPH
jgi:hypothetical protein